MIMKMIDELYTKHPFYGSPKITEKVRQNGYIINHKRIERLMGLMGISAICPGPNLSKKKTGPDHKVYPYLLKGLDINRPNQVWASDITYIRMERGFIYLTAIMDWFSRYVLSWEISVTRDNEFCKSALEGALMTDCPEIFNTDQGSQFTSDDYTGILLDKDIQISMDGRGRVFDNIFIERLWRSLKYEEVYLKDYQSIYEARQCIGNYFRFYNEERIHKALDYKTPYEVYYGQSYCGVSGLQQNHLNFA